MRGAYSITLVALCLIACSDDVKERVDQRRDAVNEDRRERAAAPRPTTDLPVLTPPLGRPRVEGAATAELVFARAQDAIAASDFVALLQCIRPSTRARWLRDLVVAVAVVSSDDGTDHDPASVAGKRKIRELLTRYGAYGSVDGADQMSADAVGRALVEKVKDPDGLYAALLDFAAEHRAAWDPVRAIEGLRRGAERGRRPDPTAAALVRLVDRVRAPNAIGPVDADGQALTRVPDAGPTDGAFLPVRFHVESGIAWLDES